MVGEREREIEPWPPARPQHKHWCFNMGFLYGVHTISHISMDSINERYYTIAIRAALQCSHAVSLSIRVSCDNMLALVARAPLVYVMRNTIWKKLRNLPLLVSPNRYAFSQYLFNKSNYFSTMRVTEHALRCDGFFVGLAECILCSSVCYVWFSNLFP